MSKISLVMNAIDNISPATRKATESQEQLNKQLQITQKESRKTSKDLSNIAAYQKQTSAVEKAQSAAKRYTEQLKVHKQALKDIAEPTAKQSEKLAILEQKATDANNALRDKSNTLNVLENALVSSKIDTDKLADAQERLTRQSKKYRSEIQKQNLELKQLSNTQDELTKGRPDIGAAAETGLKATGAILTGSSIAAMSNERSYSDVRNAADGWSEKDHASNGKWTQDLAASRDGAGINTNDLNRIQSGVIAGGAKTVQQSQQATQNVVKLMTVFKLDNSDEGVERYNDMKRLGLDDNQIMAQLGKMSGAYKGIDKNGFIEAITEVAPRVSKQGMGIDVVTSLGGALAASNMKTGEIATTIESLGERLSAGSQATTAQQEAWVKIGLTAEKGQKLAQDDSGALILDVLKRSKQYDSGEQQVILESILGSGFQTLMDDNFSGNFEKQLNTKASSENIDTRFDTTTGDAMAGIETVIASFNRLAVSIGEPLLVPIGAVADKLAFGVGKLAKFIDSLPDEVVVATALGAIVGGVGLTLKRVMSMFSGLKLIRANVVNVNGANNAGGIDADSKSGKDGKDGKRSRFKKGLGGGGFGVLGLMFAAKQYDPLSSTLAKANNAPAAEQAYKAMYQKPIPTPETYDKQAAQVAAEATSTKKIELVVKVETDATGYTENERQQLIDKTAASAYQAITDREGY